MSWTSTINDPDALRTAFASERSDPSYRPITAWWWSGETLDRERLLWQLDRIAELGCGGIAVTGLALHGPSGGSVADSPPGFSDAWLELYRLITKRAAELGLGSVSWSPFAAGVGVDSARLLERHPEFRGEKLTTRTGVEVEPYGFDFGSRTAMEALAGPGTVNGRLLEAEDDLLGESLVLMFEDEFPAFPVWSPTFAGEFRALKGYDFPVAAVDQDLGARTPAYRWDLYDVATTRVERAYTAMTSEWVDKHGMLAGFDQMSRRGTPVLTTAFYLDPFRTLRWANAPGTDQMGDARFHLSMADILGVSRVWLEGFHSHGWGMTLEHQMRLLFEWGREGANLFLPHGMYYSGRAFWWEWAPPEMGWKQPYAAHYPAFAATVGRLNTVLSAGRHVPEVAVLYPTSTIWAATTGFFEWGPEAWEAEEAYVALMGVHAAPSGQEPERAAHPSVLAEAGYDRIVVDEANVDTFDLPIVVAACRCLRTETLRRLLAAAEAGRIVVLVHPLPEWSAERGRDDDEFLALVARLTAIATVVDDVTAVTGALPPPRVGGLKSQWRRIGDLDVVMVTGRGTATFNGMGDRRPEQWDVRTGRITPLPARVDGDDLLVDLDRPATIVALPPGVPEPPQQRRWREVALPEVWDCDYLPWGENRWGDYRLPPNEGTPPVERRTFAHREGDDPAWQRAPVTPEDVQHPVVDLGFEDRMGQVRSRPAPADRTLGDGWHEVVSTYGPKAVVDGRLAEYSERLGVEDLLLTTPIGLKGRVEPVKVDLGEQGGTVVSYGHVPAATSTHLVVEGSGVLTVLLDGRHLIGPVEGGVLAVPVELDAGWHRVEIRAEHRHVTMPEYYGYKHPPRTRLAWSFTEPYERVARRIWGQRAIHPDYKGAQTARRFRRRIVVPESARVLATASATGALTLDLPEVLAPGEHVVEAFVGGSVQTGGFTCALRLEMASGTVVIGTDDRWEALGPGQEWNSAVDFGVAGALTTGGHDQLPEPERAVRSPLLDVAWLEGDEAVAGHADDAWSDSPDAPPPSWFCFTAPPGARSITLPVDGEVSAWVDGEPTPLDGDRLPLREHARVALRVQAPAGRRGAGCFREHPLLELGAGTIRVGTSWHRQGLDVFSGVILHRTEVEVDAAGPAVLDLGDVAGSVRVRVNGADAGVLAWEPWRVDVDLVAGRNTIELEVANTLGPMASRGIPTPFGPEDQRFSGVIGRPRLLVAQS